MSEDLTIDDIEDIEDIENNEEIVQLQQSLIQRCKESRIEAEIREYFDGDTYVAVGMPNGREKRWTDYFSAESIKEVLNTDFDKYSFLGDFVAIANYSANTIEAIIRPINGMPRQFLHRRLFGEVSDGDELEPLTLEETYLGRPIKIEIGEASETIRLLARGPFGRNGALSIKILGVNISQHNQSLQILRKLSDSLFFQLDLQDGFTLSLVRDRRHTRRPGHRPRRRPHERAELEFPKIEFDEGPSSLYWYGRSALGMPLLQFLAFYQVIEYYYPTYSQEEARRRIRSILKDPTFRTDRDGDIGKVLSAVSGHGRGFGDERSQLRATINACVDSNDLREFLQEDEERAEFFSAKQKDLTDHKLPLKNSDADLRAPVADLVYDIRCKIVHTKGESSEGEVELLLPFSKEAELLFFDIELMQYLARKVLIAAGAPISL
ncbi:hypothetical protein NQS96_00485 [Pseudoalteromonas shioyasakiensis]|uniref:hypothetical protein n=1 Tax=Pseudoalteromonas shioyasakiensis TaxID=1190813 RepID=UPI002119742A|nr:hypothetical protein [Pseudoalteromonas shioyasakiensis]MCQ8880272.1 hypothetical protein [Pseudoalteromonas shioyasakiensis]